MRPRIWVFFYALYLGYARDLWLVRKSDPPRLGAAGVAVWSGLVGAVYHYCYQFWLCRLVVVPGQNWLDGSPAICVEPGVQCCLYTGAIRPSKLAPGQCRDCRHTRDADLGDGGNLSNRPVGDVGEYSVPVVGILCHRASNYHYAPELVICPAHEVCRDILKIICNCTV